jgi:hypothetical protein
MPLDPKKRKGLKKIDQDFLRIIDNYGWHVMSVVRGWRTVTQLPGHTQAASTITFTIRKLLSSTSQLSFGAA